MAPKYAPLKLKLKFKDTAKSARSCPIRFNPLEGEFVYLLNAVLQLSEGKLTGLGGGGAGGE
jgi:hypothetical protein